MSLPIDLLLDSLSDSKYPEAKAITRYLIDKHKKEDLILLSIGESWSGPPPQLVNLLSSAPSWTHGYQISPMGIPALRRELAHYFVETGYLPKKSTEDVAIAAVSGGTRSVMYDFGRLLRHCNCSNWSVVSLSPGWEYGHVFEPLGFKMRYVQMASESGIVLDESSILRTFEESVERSPTLLIINAQHNPTGYNWSNKVIENLLLSAARRHAAVLIDDAHYGLCDHNVVPTPTLRIWLSILKSESHRGHLAPAWIATRSLSKEFDCNGWGVGACIGDASLLKNIFVLFRSHHHLNIGANMQFAMLEWLKRRTIAADYLVAKRKRQAKSRTLVYKALVDMGCPTDDIVRGNCTPFTLFRVPPVYRASKSDMLDFVITCIVEAGVVLSPIPTQPSDLYVGQYARVFLGGDDALLSTAFSRLAMLRVPLWRQGTSRE